jgi:hypothetical protein
MSMKPGTIIRFKPSGDEATVVFHGLSGYGVRWGHHELTAEDIAKINSTNPLTGDCPPDFDLEAHALLREPYDGSPMPCCGEDYTILSVPGEDA